jgi:uncharacterized protein (UPF0261 family)
LKASGAPVSIVLPIKGISQVDSEGGVFYRPDIDEVLFDSIKTGASGIIQVKEVDAHINDEDFSAFLVDELLGILNDLKGSQKNKFWNKH